MSFTWNALSYTKFKKERTQPAIDLINAVHLDKPKRILDIGCGPATSTEQLYFKWSDAEIIGIDTSENMLDDARLRLPNAEFQLRDATGDLGDLGKFDLIFSNAAIQWMSDHDVLLPKLYSMLNTGGALAIQQPNVSKMAITKAIRKTLNIKKWNGRFEKPAFRNVACMDYYYEICAQLTDDFLLWTTDYVHPLDGHQAIFDWYKSSGLRPYFAKLNEDEAEQFTKDILCNIKKQYQLQSDGKVLFPFTRQFMLLYNK